VIPEFSIGVPMPQMSMPGMLSMPSRNTGLMIGNALMGGMQAGMAYTAPGNDFFGIPGPKVTKD
jgi:hypothetical protein